MVFDIIRLKVLINKLSFPRAGFGDTVKILVIIVKVVIPNKNVAKYKNKVRRASNLLS